MMMGSCIAISRVREPVKVLDFLLSLDSRQYPRRRKRAGQARGLRRVWPAFSHHDEEEHICRYAVLDGTGGHQAVWLRRQGGHLVARNHSTRAGEWRATVCRHPPHESPLPYTEEPATTAARQLLACVQGVYRAVSEEGSAGSAKCKAAAYDELCAQGWEACASARAYFEVSGLEGSVSQRGSGI